jgi:hypothetical protein
MFKGSFAKKSVIKTRSFWAWKVAQSEWVHIEWWETPGFEINSQEVVEINRIKPEWTE